ncbi:hypothetical protein NQ317_000804 [Molorchus minor]|uniref:G-protein coupled receptors family 1 profile domain-containing protein n=1 Tax=Molorchus minor TaxID=1323400 RepID=A0ABQ9J3Z8_9CUCU|nr:hypothetical protein NQ317_000804 [Molorchus minor]
MGSSFLFHEGYLYFSGENNVWNDEPTLKGTVLYSIITPIICSFGICGNTLSLMVLKRRELVGSVYTYLAVLAAMDLSMSVLLFLGGLSRGALYYRGWATYDALIGLPLGGIINSLSVTATVGVTIDRVLFLWNPVQCTKPKFCNPNIARKLMMGALLVSIILNIPYCFIFTRDDEKELTTSEFFDSLFYRVFNWFMLVFFSIIPAIILILGNGFLLLSLKKARKIGMKCHGKRKDHINLTVTLISIILLFLISEIPSALVSRTKAVSILFSGNHDRANSRTLEIFRQICTLLGAVNVTVNFLFYYLFCPSFCRALAKTLRKKSRAGKSVQVNIFVVNNDRFNEKRHSLNDKVKAKILEISRKSIEPNLHFSSYLSNDGENSSDNGFDHENGGKSRQVTEESDYIEVIDDYRMSPGSAILEESSENTSSVIKNGKHF